MKIIRRIPGRPLGWRAPVAAIGIFDGVHRGHQTILRRAVRRAQKFGGTPVAVTFHPHPTAVLAPHAIPTMILSIDQRLQAFAGCGIRAAVVVPFTRALSRLSPEAFVKLLLVERLRVKEVFVGHDFGFGAGRKGTVETLRALGDRYGFNVHVAAPVRARGARISSRGIRQLITEGHVEKAAAVLGRPAQVAGRVVSGKGRGAELGFPTANLKIFSGILPAVGVYAVRGRVGPRRYRGMANIGYRPTFVGKRPAKPLLEAHFFGVKRPLYGRTVELEFIRRLRAERKFPSARLLAAQLKRDAARARKVLA